MGVKIPASLLATQIRQLYDIPPEASLETLSEPLRTWVDYAMGTVQRGRWVLEELVPHGLRPGFRYLDAGCAYGGFLAAAAEIGAREVVGVDVNEKYLNIARELLGATGLPARIESGSVSDGNLIDSLGRFDVITCADVIEHVDDVPATLANLARALVPGGLLYLAVPNAWSPACVRRDPHFQLFGITLLPHSEARGYYRRISGSDYYDVGEFHRLQVYERELQSHGLQTAVINMPGSEELAVQELLAETEGLETDAHSFADERLPSELVVSLRKQALELAESIRRRLREASAGRRSWLPWTKPVDRASVVRDHAIRTWHLLGRRV